MIETILIFFLFLGPLIFFHELGHFLFARLFGVRVEVFSIGFGPKILRWKRGHTEYALSVIPLGGYVKMFGDDPFAPEKVKEEDRSEAFLHKSKWARFWIIFGGPLANFIMAFAIYYVLLLGGEKVPETKFGIIPDGSLFHQQGIRSADILKKINGHEIFSVEDIIVPEKSIKSVTVQRANELLTLDGFSIPVEEFIKNFASSPPQFRMPYLVDESGNLFALSLEPRSVDIHTSLEEFKQFAGRSLYLIPVLTDESESPSYAYDKAKKYEVFSQGVLEFFYEKGFYPHDVSVNSIVMSSPAERASIRKGDIITKVGEQEVLSFEDIKGLVQESKGEPVSFTILRDGQKLTHKLSPEKKEVDGAITYAIGVWSGIQFSRPRMIETKPLGVLKAAPRAMARTWDGIIKTFDGFLKLITNQVSMKNIGGPIAIGKVASDSFHISMSYFFRLMAIISINLGIINLFPIPVLDGGHIMFLGFELVNRGPLSRRKLEIAQQFGVSLLFLLIFVAIYNDITRIF